MVEGQVTVEAGRFAQLTTAELQEIWNKHDTYQYSGADFEKVKALLEGHGLTVAQVTTSEDARLTGIGGWLVLPAIGMIVSPLVNIYNMAVTAEALNNAPTRLHAALNFELVTNFLLMIFCIIAAILFYMRKAAAPTTIIAMISTVLILTVVESFMVYEISERLFEEFLLPELVRSVLVACVWIPYFLNSKRVRLTFTR